MAKTLCYNNVTPHYFITTFFVIQLWSTANIIHNNELHIEGILYEDILGFDDKKVYSLLYFCPLRSQYLDAHVYVCFKCLIYLFQFPHCQFHIGVCRLLQGNAYIGIISEFNMKYLPTHAHRLTKTTQTKKENPGMGALNIFMSRV